MSTLATTIGRGVTGSRPAASEAGRLYYDTTTNIFYRDNGSSWDSVSPSALTNPMTGVGDTIQGTTGGTPVALAAPLAGKVLTGAGLTTPLVYAYPPGYELDYVQKTTNTTLSATTEGTATTIITSSSITFDGALVVATFYSPGITTNATLNADVSIILRDDTGSSVLGTIVYHQSQAAAANYVPSFGQLRFTPAAGARTYSVRGFSATNSPIVLGGAGGSGNFLPAFLRFQKV